MVKKENQQRLQHVIAEGAPTDRPEMIRWRWLIAVLILATASLAYPVVTGAFLVNPQSDLYIAGYGFREFAAQSLRSGNGFPQWNSFMFGGMPFAAALHGDVFYPTFLLRMLMRTDLAITWAFVIHLFAAGLFTLGFLRAVGVSPYAALFGGLAYMLSGPITSFAYVGNDGQLFVSALLPLGLWMLTRAIRDERQIAWSVYALTVGLATLSGASQQVEYFLLVIVSYAAFLLWNKTNKLALIATTVTITLLGLCIGAVQYWPAFGYLPSSAAAHGNEYNVATRMSLPPEEILNSYLPQFSGILDRYWGRNRHNLQSDFVGVVVLMLAPFAFGGETRKAFTRFWLGVTVVALFWAFGGYTPFFHLVYALVPGTRLFIAPGAMFGVVTFALCVLSAVGFDRLLSRQTAPRTINRQTVAWIAFAVLITVLGAAGTLDHFAQWLTEGAAEVTRYDRALFEKQIRLNSPLLLAGAFRSLAFVLLVALILKAYQVRRVSLNLAAVVLIGLCGADLWSNARRYWQFSEPANDLFRSDATISYLKSQKEPGRVFVYTKTADYRTATDPYFGASGYGDGGGLMVHGIRTVAGYHNNPLANYERLSGGNALIDPAFWRHENVRWLYTNDEIADTVLKRVMGPITNSAGSAVIIYEMPGENSYAWVASSFGARNDTAAVKELREDTYNPHTFVAVDPATVVNGARVHPAPALPFDPSTITTKVSDFGAGRATVQLSAPSQEGNALVISENYYKGWRATANGKVLDVMRTSFNLVGVALPAGVQTVSLSFEDPRYRTGRMITWIALLFTALLIPVSRLLRRRTPAPSAAEYRMTPGDAV